MTTSKRFAVTASASGNGKTTLARELARRLDVPTLLVYGDRDVRAPLTVAEALHAAISGSRLVVLPDAGHLCNIEAPDEFSTAVRNFLQESRR